MDKLRLIDDMFACEAHGQMNIYMAQKLDLNASIICDELEQCEDYWINKHKTVDGWWWTTYSFLTEETGLSKKQIMRAVKDLADVGIVQTAAPKYEDGVKKKYYKMDYLAKDEFMRSPYDKSVSRNYKPTNFIIYNKKLGRLIGPGNAVIIRDLCKTYVETAKRNNLFENEWFEANQVKLSKKCGVTRKTMVAYIKDLVAKELIETRLISWPRVTYVKINFNKLLELLGYGSWQELSDHLDFIQAEKAKKNANKVELVTRLVLDKVKKVSGQQWSFTYDKLASIEARLNEGHTQEELLQVVEDRYKSWVEDKELFEKYFTWDGVIGRDSSPSTVNSHLDSIKRKDIKEQKRLEAEKVTATLCAKMAEHSKGEIEWIIDDKKVESIRKVLAWPENFNEEDLLSFAINRYDFNKKSNWKMTAFNTLFSNKEKENMQKNRNARQYEEAKKSLEKTQSKKESREGYGITCENDLRRKIDQDSITGVQGQDYF